MNSEVFLHPFALGLYLGLIFAALALYRLFRVKGDLKRYKRHLSDKLEIEADSAKRIRSELEAVRKENENLRVKVSTANQAPDQKLQRDLEVYARAEKSMMVSVPGFAPAWENAKNAALQELEAEESGRSLPKKVFTRLFGTGRREELPGKEPQ